MIRSMTGYAQSDFEAKNFRGTVEIKSVNHRFFDLNFRLPSSLNSHESEIRKLVRSRVTRGKINISVFLDNTKEEGVHIDLNLAEGVVKSAKKLSKEYGLENDLTVSDLFQVPNLVQPKRSTEKSVVGWTSLKAEIAAVLEEFLASKIKEGIALEKDLNKRVKNISKLVKQVESRKQKHAGETLEKMKERLKNLSGEVEVDLDRIQKELIMWADKTDITEEIVRLNAHIELFEKTIKEKDVCGKDLDFLIQEMNRETNTIASKAQDTELSHTAVDIKGEIERIREQIQNIE